MACVIVAGASLGAFAAVGTGHKISLANPVDLRFFFAYQGEVVRVDPASGLVDGRTPIPDATPGTEVVDPVGGENVYTATPQGAVSAVDPMTLTATDPTLFSQGVEPVEGEHHSYVLEPRRGKVSVYPPGELSLGSTVAPEVVTLTVGWSETVVDAASVLWVLSDDGRTLHRLDGSVRSDINIVGTPATDLTLVEGRVTLYRPGEILVLGDDRRFSSVRVDLAGYDRVELGAETSIGPNLWLVASGGDAEAVLVEVDLGAEADAGAGERRRYRLSRAGTDLDAPVFDGTTVFVADQDEHAVHTLDVQATNPHPLIRRFDHDGDASDITVTRGGDWTAVNDGAGAIYNVRPGEALGDAPAIPLGSSTVGPEASASPSAGGETPAASTTEPSTLPTEPPAADESPGAETPPAPPRQEQVAAPSATSTPAGQEQGQQLRSAPVPDVVGQDKDSGCQALRVAGFNCQQRAAGQGAARLITPEGTILATTPGASSTFELGATVVVDYASPGAPVLVGRSADQICDVVRAAGLTCDPAPRTDVAPAVGWLGLVSSQFPAAGQAVQPGETIIYSYYDRIAAPNLVGMSQVDACAAIQLSALLTCQVGTTVPGTAATAGTVATQNPPANTVLPAAPSTVTIDVYAAPAPVVPAVVGAGITVDAACAQVSAAGLTCQQVVSPYRVPGEVFAQNPPAGTVTTPGAVVQVSVWTLPRREVLRYRQTDMDRVWLLRIDASGVPTDRYELRSSVGFAAAPGGTPETDQFLVPITDFMCPTCAYDINHYHTADRQPPSGSGWQNNGVQAYVFRDQVPGSVPLYRLFWDAPEGRTWAYARQGENAYKDYVDLGYRQQVVLGYVWPN